MKSKLTICFGFSIIVSIMLIIGYFFIHQLTIIEAPFEKEIPMALNQIHKKSTLDGQAQLIKYYDEVLTQSARNYAFTQDVKWKTTYKTAEPVLDMAINNIMKIEDIDGTKFLADINDANRALVELEYKSIELVDNGYSSDAIKILESKEYWNQKIIYKQALNNYVKIKELSYDNAFASYTQKITSMTESTHVLIENGINMVNIVTLTISVLCAILGFFIIGNISKNENKLHAAKNEFHYLYDENPDLLCTVSTEGIIIKCNKTYEKVLGYSKNEIIGKPYIEFIADKNFETAKDAFSSFLMNGQMRDNEIWIRKSDGNIFPSIISGNGKFNENGKLVEGIVTIKDATELSNAKMNLIEKEIQLAIKEEKSKNDKLVAIGEIAARLGHDLRNPLSVIMATLEIMKLTDDKNGFEKNRTKYDIISRALLRMSHQVNDVLDFVRIKPLTLCSHSILEIIKDTLQAMKIPNNIKINLSQDDVKIVCDSKRLDVVFVNLMMNAVQAIGNNAGEITIKICDDKDNVCISIEDSGPGIPNNILPKIFEPLFTTKQTGTGLGLVSCKNIVEQHGGNITVKNNPTTFTIKLPKSPLTIGSNQVIVLSSKTHAKENSSMKNTKVLTN